MGGNQTVTLNRTRHRPLCDDTVEKLTLRAALPFQLKSVFCYFSYLASKLWLNTVKSEWFQVFYAI
jgi:hypothetical protein